MAGQPIIILKEGTERESGKSARQSNIAAAIAIADAVRSTLGPRGMDKMLVDSLGEVVVTNDGAKILKELEVEHPAAKMMVEVAKTQDNEVGDGTTTAVILAGELLKRAGELADKNVHPTVITAGYKLAEEKAFELLDKVAIDITADQTGLLKNVAETAISGKNVGGGNEYLAELSVKSVKMVAEKVGDGYSVDTDDIKIEKKHGASVSESEIVSGLVIDKERVHPRMPARVEDARIALITSALEIKKTEVSSSIQIKDPSLIQKFLDQEDETLREMADSIVAAGANVVICEKGISDTVQHYLAKAGIYAVQRAKKSDMEKLSRATGGKLVANIRDLGKSDLGKAKEVEQRKISNEEMTFITGCRNPKSVTVLLRGGTEHVVDELEAAFTDAMRVVAVAIEDGKVVAGGGSVETYISMRLRDYSSGVGGREQLAVEAFATALEYIPRTLAENSGLDPVDLLIELKSRHARAKGACYDGIAVEEGKIKDMLKAKVLEPIRVKRQAIASASEVANMILRIDDVIASKKGAGGSPGGMPPGGMPPGGMPPGMM